MTATGAQAFVGPDALRRAGLSEEQVAALEEARGLRAEGEVKKAREVLVKAGIDESAIASVRSAVMAAREAVHQAIEDGDYEAFRKAIVDTPLADIITTEDDFKQFKKAHDLKWSGEHEKARAIFDDLGIAPSLAGSKYGGVGREYRMRHSRGYHGGADGHWLSKEQHDALRAARQANDQDTVQAILDEVGERSSVRGQWW